MLILFEIELTVKKRSSGFTVIKNDHV